MEHHDIAIARLKERADTAEKNISTLWENVNKHGDECDERGEGFLLRANQYTDQKIDQVRLQVALEAKDLAQSIAREIKGEIRGDASIVAKIADWSIRVGILIGIAWVGFNQAHAAEIPCDAEPVNNSCVELITQEVWTLTYGSLFHHPRPAPLGCLQIL